MERMDNVEAARNGIMRKWVIITVTKCYRSVWNHPFLVVTLYLLILVYRSFPFLFSTLVSVSPVLVCAGVLLGTLLSFGRPNKPGVEDGHSFSHVTSFKASSNLEDAIVAHDSGENHVAERFTSEKQDVVEKFMEEATITSVSEKDVYNNTSMTLSGTSYCEVSSKKDDDEYMKKGSPDMEVEMKREVSMRRFNINYEEAVESCERDLEIHRESGGPINSDDIMKSPSPFEWKEDDDYATSREEDDDEDSQSLDTDPDKGECSPRNPLKDHVFHMLDGSHPFLEKEASLLAQLSCDDFEASSKHTHKSENGFRDSNEDCSIMKEKDDRMDKGAGRKMEEESKEAKNNNKEKKSAITWTEDDQNNLMVLGISESERNRRLESLIARRRARKSLGLMVENNLMDLDGPDLPVNIPAIATMRRNPFDGPDDYYASMGLPPIPGSAPSVLLPRRNPFDLPYEPNEEKPDLKGDSFQQEFSFDQNKDVLFSRHASFNVRHTRLCYKQEKQDFKRRPYFVSEAEQLGLEESSNSLLHRQMSNASDSNSKLSSIPDTESEISDADNDDKSSGIQECYEETEVIPNDQSMLLFEHENDPCEGIVYEDTEVEDESAIPRDGAVITLGKMETENLMESTFTKSKAAVFPLDLIMNSSLLRTASSIEEECNSMSRSSSFSEVNGIVLNVKNDTMSNSNTRIDMTMEKSLTMENPSEVSNFSFPALTTEGNQHKEAIYDSSPQEVDKSLSLSSISSDNFEETFAMVSSPESVNATHNIEDEPNYEEMFAAYSKMEDESSSRSKEVREIKESTSYDIISSEVKETIDADHDFLVPESVLKHKPTGLSSPSSITESVEGHAISEDHFKKYFFETQQDFDPEGLHKNTKFEEQLMWKEGAFGAPRWTES